MVEQQQNESVEEQQSEVTEEQAVQLHASLMRLADVWEKRLADPVVMGLYKAGRIQVNPLVLKLLELKNSNALGQSTNPSETSPSTSETRDRNRSPNG